MKSLITSFALVLSVFSITGCSDGPSGPHPTQELKVIYDRPPLTGVQIEVSARMISGGDSVFMSSLAMPHDGVFGTSIYLSASPVTSSGVPTLQLNFPKLPTAPGTYEFTAAEVKQGLLGLEPKSNQGAFVSIGGNLYAPVSGTITITEVRKDASFIYGYSGYVNGQLQAMWPKGFRPTASQPFPPGFSITAPTLIGEKLTLHSASFKTRATIAIPIPS